MQFREPLRLRSRKATRRERGHPLPLPRRSPRRRAAPGAVHAGPPPAPRTHPASPPAATAGPRLRAAERAAARGRPAPPRRGPWLQLSAGRARRNFPTSLLLLSLPRLLLPGAAPAERGNCPPASLSPAGISAAVEKGPSEAPSAPRPAGGWAAAPPPPASPAPSWGWRKEAGEREAPLFPLGCSAGYLLLLLWTEGLARSLSPPLYSALRVLLLPPTAAPGLGGVPTVGGRGSANPRTAPSIAYVHVHTDTYF